MKHENYYNGFPCGFFHCNNGDWRCDVVFYKPALKRWGYERRGVIPDFKPLDVLANRKFVIHLG